jgi:DNA-binding NtrC family response regulator
MAASRRRTVLVIDDEALIRWSLGERLRLEGCDVIEATPGRSGLEQVSDRVDLIIFGCEVDDPAGCRMLAQLKRLAPRVPLIVLTTCHTADTARRALQLGAWAVAKKPFGLDRIAEMAAVAGGPPETADSSGPA